MEMEQDALTGGGPARITHTCEKCTVHELEDRLSRFALIEGELEMGYG